MSSISSAPGFSYVPREKLLPELCKQSSDPAIKKLPSPHRSGSALVKSHSIQWINQRSVRRLDSISRLLSFSPRTSPETIQTVSNNFKTYFIEKNHGLDLLSPILFQILALVCYNQYTPITPDNDLLIAGLHKTKLLEPCLLAIQYLAGKDNQLLSVPPINLLKLGLQIMLHPFGQILLTEKPARDIAEQVLSLSKEYTRELQELIHKVEDTLTFRKENSRFSLDIAQEGLGLLKRWIRELTDKEEFLHIELLQKEPFKTQKIFLFSLQTFLLNSHFRLRIDDSKKELLVQLSIRLFLAPDSANLFLQPKIKEIGQQLITLSSHEYPSSFSPRFIELFHVMSNLPSIPLQGLQLLMTWMQQPSTEIDDMLNIAAGTREWDLQGDLYFFALLKFQEIALQPKPDKLHLYQLLHFIYCWEKAPANQDLLALPEFYAKRQKHSVIRLNFQDLQELIEKEFSDRDLLCFKEFSLPSICPNPLFDGTAQLRSTIPAKASHLWKKESIVNDLRDTIVFYLLEARGKVNVADLTLHSRKPSQSMLLQAKRFNQITQFFVKELLAFEHSLSSILSIIKILCALQAELLKYSAFEAAWSIHVVFQQSCISRLRRAFSLEPAFFEQFNRPDIWCSPENNFQRLKNLQIQSSETFEASPIIVHELTHLRENPHEFTKEGKVHADRLQRFGKLFNNFAIRKQQALRLWTSECPLDPDLFLIKAFDSQSGVLDDEMTELIWWERSQEIHPHASKVYWGEICQTL